MAQFERSSNVQHASRTAVRLRAANPVVRLRNPRVLFVYKNIYVLFSVIWAAGLAIGSPLPRGPAPPAEGEQIYFFFFVLHPFGFGLHLIGYAIFGLVLVLTLKKYAVKNDFLYAIVIAAVYGLAMEGLQAFVPNRDPSIIDAVVNTVGAFISATIYQIKYGTKILAQR